MEKLNYVLIKMELQQVKNLHCENSMFHDLKFCSFRVTRRKRQSASIPAEDSDKQVLCVSFRGYLRPCDFANPAFGLLCISTEDCRCGQARLHAHTYRCSRRENDWRLKKKSWKKERGQRIETNAR